jgi:hypothetical protein
VSQNACDVKEQGHGPPIVLDFTKPCNKNQNFPYRLLNHMHREAEPTAGLHGTSKLFLPMHMQAWLMHVELVETCSNIYLAHSTSEWHDKCTESSLETTWRHKIEIRTVIIKHILFPIFKKYIISNFVFIVQLLIAK